MACLDGRFFAAPRFFYGGSLAFLTAGPLAVHLVQRPLSLLKRGERAESVIRERASRLFSWGCPPNSHEWALCVRSLFRRAALLLLRHYFRALFSMQAGEKKFRPKFKFFRKTADTTNGHCHLSKLMWKGELQMPYFGVVEMLFVALVVVGVLAIIFNKPGEKVRGDYILDRLYSIKESGSELDGHGDGAKPH